MDLHSSGSPDKVSLLHRNDSSLHRDNLSYASDVTDSHDPMVQRCVIIQKDEKGYGLTVSGDNPVFVQSVKEDGAAARAGVQQGDRIIKVNGTLVTQSNHQEVVELIKSGSLVALTLLGKPHNKGSSLSPQQSFSIVGSNALGNKSSERITGPQPVDPEKQQQLTNSRIHTIRKMLEKEVVYLENLRSEFSKTPSEKIRAEVNGAVKRVKTLEEQLFNLTGITHEHISARSPKSPTSARHNPDRESHRSISFPAPGHQNRLLMHQSSAPLLPSNQDPHQQPFTPSPEASDTKYLLTLSPCSDSGSKSNVQSPDGQKQSLSASLENISKHLSPKTTTWPQHTHTRQSSSPETLGFDKCQKINGVTKTDSVYRSPSAVSPSYGGHRSFSSDSDSKSPYPTSSSRGSSFGQGDSIIESSIASPPKTPEPNESKLAGDSFEDDKVHQDDFGTPPESATTDINLQSVATKLGQNPSIICMEDDDFSSDTEMGHFDDHGPFCGLWKLVKYPAHLSVFLHYLMSNSDPSSLFFYLISEMYEQGTGKEMKKWAYEIHSSFLVPGAPLKVSLVDETILHSIDEVLLNHIDKEETLRTVFIEARKKAREEVNDFLADFRNKRTMGLANIFGPPDYQLEEAMHDKNRELKIIEQVLLPCLESSKPYTEDLEGVDDRAAAKAYALATILKQYAPKSSQVASLLERCPTFVAKEKSLFRFLQRNKKVIFLQGHHFIPQHYYSVTYCNHCQLIIWGVGNQGYQCQNCDMNIHKSCSKVVEEHCIGALRHKKKEPKERTKRDRKSYIMENIIGKTRKPSQPVPAAIEKARKLNEEMNANNGLSVTDIDHAKTEAERGTDEFKAPSDVVFQNMVNLHESAEKSNLSKRSAASIGRSESFRQRRESKPSFRKRSDPNIPRSKSDVDVDDKAGLNESRSSSNSSLSNRSLDSPCNSSEMVHRTPTSVSADSVPANFAPSALASSGNHTANMHSYDDSDLEADVDPPTWQDNVDWDVLKQMKPKEKKRQDVINELFHTERTHVRNLKVLDRLFYRPMLQEQLLPADFLSLLFPNLEEMLDIHSNFNQKMKARRKEEPIIGDIGQLMLEMFDGPAGEHLKHAAATYCENQSIALESLKMRQKKDQKLAQSLADAEMNNLCRRLQLKDIIASGFQRLTKYPLLLENIAKYSQPDSQEHIDLLRAVECSKHILVHVDAAIKEAENRHRLLDIQKKMEKSSFEKVEHPIVQSFKHLDVTKHKLLHEGPLTWRLNKQKTLEMHVVLLEELLILFQKQDEKYILKFHNTNLTSGREDTKVMHSPILRVHNLLIRPNASDKRSIFLISSSEMHAMYEFVASTTSEKKIWSQHLTKAVEAKTQSENSLHRIHPEPVPPNPETPPNADETAEESESDAKVPDPAVDVPEETKPEEPTNPEPEQPHPPAEPDIPPPSVPPDETPQRARRVIESAESESDSGPLSRLQRIEIVHVTEAPHLIEPSEVVVSGVAVFETADPVLTPVEKLRHKHLEIVNAIEEKEQILCEVFDVPLEELRKSKEISMDSEELSVSDLLRHASLQANQLTTILNDGLNIVEDARIHESSKPPEESSPKLPKSSDRSSPYSYFFRPQGVSHQSLLPVTNSLNACLNRLMEKVSEMEDERTQLRRELQSCREQIHQLQDSHRHCVPSSQSQSSHSRPSSFVSVGSTASDGVAEFFENQQLFSVLEKTEEPGASDSEPAPQEPCATIQQSSSPNTDQPVSQETSLPVTSAPPQNRTCDDLPQEEEHTLNCDAPCFEDTGGVSSSMCKMNLSPIMESDSLRTVVEDPCVDPVYL